MESVQTALPKNLHFCFSNILPVSFFEICVLYVTLQLSSNLQSNRRIYGKGVKSMTTLKWMFTAILAVFAWLITGYTVEYFKPYKKK
jgi:hypothetical protein